MIGLNLNQENNETFTPDLVSSAFVSPDVPPTDLDYHPTQLLIKTHKGPSFVLSSVMHAVLILLIGYGVHYQIFKEEKKSEEDANKIYMMSPSLVYHGGGGGPGHASKPGGGGGGGGRDNKVIPVPTSPKPKFPNPKPMFQPDPAKIPDDIVNTPEISAVMPTKLALQLPKDYSTLDNLGLAPGVTNLGGKGGGVGGGQGTGVGSGKGSGIGTGEGSGWGSGKGSGWGSGEGPGSGDGIYMAGNGVMNPVPILQPEPKFTDEAIKNRINGVVLLYGIVRKNGMADALKVVRGLGYGLDEEALQTVMKKWKFRPGTKGGHPVDCYVSIEVSFSLY